MSETEATADETGEPAQPTSTDSGSDFITEAEKEIIQEWTVYVTGLFAAVGVALGLNGIIQDQWDHALVSPSSGATQAGAILHTGNVLTFMFLGIVGATLLGFVYARRIDNENQAAFKVGAVTALVGVPVLLVLATFLYTVQLDNWDPEFANLVVSGLGAGIAGAVGSAITIWLTENHLPEALN